MVWMAMTIVTIVAIMAEILIPNDLVFAVMRTTIYLGLMSMMIVLVKSG